MSKEFVYAYLEVVCHSYQYTSVSSAFGLNDNSKWMRKMLLAFMQWKLVVIEYSNKRDNPSNSHDRTS